jgi:hypothetical protein
MINSHFEAQELLSLIQRLDLRLNAAIADLETANESERSAESPDLPPWQILGSRLEILKQRFRLTDFDLDVIAIALAPELDRRYEQIYAYLQADVRAKRPTVNLALTLLCSSALEKIDRRRYFSSDSPLICNTLLHLVSDIAHPTLLERNLVLDDQVIRFLLHQPGLDPQLLSSCNLKSTPSDRQLAQPWDALCQWIERADQTHSPLRLYFQGVNESSKRDVIAALNRPVLTVNLGAIRDNTSTILKRVFREAEFQNAILYLEKIDSLQDSACFDVLLHLLSERQTVTLLSGRQSWVPSQLPLGVVTIAFPMPDAADCYHNWQAALSKTSFVLTTDDIKTLATRFRLTAAQIEDAIATVINQTQWQALQTQRIALQPTLNDWFEAARAQSGHELRTLAQKVQLRYQWQDLVLPPDALALLQELCNQAIYRDRVYENWGFGQKLSQGKGLNALFCGLPGTGKTMAAEVIAQTLQLDLYRIDLSQVVSKYIGETEKNLDRIFKAAIHSNAILLFDEADALFGKRSEVQDAHDRYANIEIGYLLQKMEAYEGIAILTTNSRSSLDDAFIRRLQFIVEFPLPDLAERSQIWQQIFPVDLPQSTDLNFEQLAQNFEISGASIRNIALAAAFLAATQETSTLTMHHITQAARREYQKLGKFLTL